MRPHTWSRPKPLLKVASNTVIGHILDQMREITTEEVIFVVGYGGDQIEQWIQENYSHLDTHFVVQEEALGQAHAVWLCRDYLDDGDVVVAFGDGIIEADYANLNKPAADAVFLVQEIEDARRFGVAVLNDDGYVVELIEKPPTTQHKLAIAGINWFRRGQQLFEATDTIIKSGRKTLGEYFMIDAYQVLLENGAKIRTEFLKQWEDAGTPQALLQTNARLLSAGYASYETLERAFAESFAVVPPVYVHPSAEISESVIGPYTSVEANAKITNSVIRNSIIDPGAVISNCVLENTLIGENAEVTGRAKALFVGDNSKVEIG
jgi:glucose-1-phosphate thymidylyltransferase